MFPTLALDWAEAVAECEVRRSIITRDEDNTINTMTTGPEPV